MYFHILILNHTLMKKKSYSTYNLTIWQHIWTIILLFISISCIKQYNFSFQSFNRGEYSNFTTFDCSNEKQVFNLISFESALLKILLKNKICINTIEKQPIYKQIQICPDFCRLSLTSHSYNPIGIINNVSDFSIIGFVDLYGNKWEQGSSFIAHKYFLENQKLPNIIGINNMNSYKLAQMCFVLKNNKSTHSFIIDLRKEKNIILINNLGKVNIGNDFASLIKKLIFLKSFTSICKEGDDILSKIDINNLCRPIVQYSSYL
nr:hypothetical protein [Mesostigma viride]